MSAKLELHADEISRHGSTRVSLRAMSESDLQSVLAIELSAYAFPWTEGIFRDCLRVGYVCRVLEVDGEVSGYGIMSMGAGEAHVLNVCVGPRARCRGFGRTMLRSLLDRAAHAGMREAFLEVRPSNRAAIRLYQSMGFQIVGVRRGYYQAVNGREDASVLSRSLSP